MGAFYYLISSLPMLSLSETPVISLDKFMSASEDFLSDKMLNELKALSLLPSDCSDSSESTVASDWYNWETCFRNAILRMRVKGKGRDTEHYIREELDFFSEIEKGVQNAFSKSTPLEMENALDALRWQRLENMETGHVFDFTNLSVYKLKLMLCEKYLLLNKEKGSKSFDQLVDYIYKEGTVAPIQIEA